METIVFEAEIPGVQISHIKRTEPFTMYENHAHEEYEIYYLIEGERYYLIGGKTYVINSGSIALINRDEIHKTSAVDSPYHERILISLKQEPMNTLLEASGELTLSDFFSGTNCVLELNENQNLQVEELIWRMVHAIKEERPGYKLTVMTLVAQMILLLQEEPIKTEEKESELTEHSHRQEVVNQVTNYLAKNYKEKLSLVDVAELFFLNKSYLSRIFKEVTGYAVNEYINLCRMKKARELLRTTDSQIIDIAFKVGYDSTTYFNKMFKKYHQISPREYRNSHF